MMRDPGDLGIAARLHEVTYGELVDNQVAIVGSPATVVEQIEQFVLQYRVGHLLVMLQVGSMPRELTEHNITLFARDVLPRLRQIWTGDDWPNHAWPSRLLGDRHAAGTPT